MEPAVHSLDISKSRDARERLIVALDVSSAKAARRIVEAVGDSALTYKVGMQLYTAEGPSVVRDMVASGRQVFLDLQVSRHSEYRWRGGKRSCEPRRQHADRAWIRWRAHAARSGGS